MSGKKIIIVNQRQYCGGSLVLSTLCATLRELGYDARLFLFPAWAERKRYGFQKFKLLVKILLVNLKWDLFDLLHWLFPGNEKLSTFYEAGNTSFVEGTKRHYLPFFNNSSIVLYPEIIFGNPLYAKNVARWYLYFDRYKDDPCAYGDKDIFVSYLPQYNNPERNPEGHNATLNCFNFDLYRQTNFGERTGCCYVYWKGANRPDLPDSLDGPLCDSLSEKDKVECFNKYKYCYIYDPYSFYGFIAAVCGCIPVVIPEEGKTIEDYVTPEKPDHYGIAYGKSEEQIRYAIETRDLLIKSLDYTSGNIASSKYFAEILEKRFGKIARIK